MYANQQCKKIISLILPKPTNFSVAKFIKEFVFFLISSRSSSSQQQRPPSSIYCVGQEAGATRPHDGRSRYNNFDH